MAVIKAILFDCDGTLVDTEEISSAAVADALENFGVEMTADEVNHEFIGVHLDDILKIIEDRHGVFIPDKEFLNSYTSNMMINIPKHIRILSDTVAYIKAMRERGYKMTVGSNGVRDVVRAELDVVGLSQFFDAIITADDVPNAKPHPDMYLAGMKAVGITDPESCLVVEDSVPGLKAAIAGGMVPIGYTGLNPNPGVLEQKLKEAGAFRVIKHLRELDSLLK